MSVKKYSAEQLADELNSEDRENNWRRFEIINPEAENELTELIERKCLSRDDLTFILKNIRLRDSYISPQQN